MKTPIFLHYRFFQKHPCSQKTHSICGFVSCVSREVAPPGWPSRHAQSPGRKRVPKDCHTGTGGWGGTVSRSGHRRASCAVGEGRSMSERVALGPRAPGRPPSSTPRPDPHPTFTPTPRVLPAAAGGVATARAVVPGTFLALLRRSEFRRERPSCAFRGV